MNNDKVNAAKKLVPSLASAFDFDLWLDSHPNEDRALERLQNDLEAEEPERWDGMN